MIAALKPLKPEILVMILALARQPRTLLTKVSTFPDPVEYG